MPLEITSSSNIATLDSHIIGSLCDGKFYVDVANSVFIGSGAINILGASVKVTSPLGVIIKNFPTSGYDIANDSPPMSTIVEVNIPTTAGNYQYGTYTVEVAMTDEDGTVYTLTKTIKLCVPDADHKTRNYGSLSATLNGICRDGKLFVTADTPPNYNGKSVESQVNVLRLDYPTASGEDSITAISLSAFSVQLYEGVYKLSGTICATYNFGDAVYVEVLYKVLREKDIKCIIDECCVFSQLAQLHKELGEECTNEQKEKLSSITVSALSLYELAKLAATCGEDPSEFLTELEALLGCKCTCNCNEGTPIINNSPAKDFVIEGCNVTKETIGLTDHYTIENYSYEVSLNDNGGILTVGSASVQGCRVITPLTLNYGTLYNKIKQSANGNYLAWRDIINKAWDAIDPTCLGYTSAQWVAMNFLQRGQVIANAACTGGKCLAQINEDETSSEQNDVIIEWNEIVEPAEVAIFIDDVLAGVVLGGVGSFKAVGKADGETHTYSIVCKCSNGVFGNALDGEFTKYGCPVIAKPTVSLTTITDADCPYDLTALVSALPSGITSEWHNLQNTSSSSLVADPENATTGTYWVYAKNSEGCYSEGVKVLLTCSTETNCSAPQNITVIDAGDDGFLVRFISAAYPPPANSYTVKRKLAVDADVDGSYTTIGTPTYNLSTNRWEIFDETGSNNTLYTYKAISNCSSTSPSVTTTFANITCPVLNLTPGTTTMDYSFAPSGGSIDKYEISIYDLDGTTLIHTDTKTPSFSNPTTGTFIYLDESTPYRVSIRAFIGSYYKDCAPVTETTASSVNGTIQVLTGVVPVTLGSSSSSGTITAATSSTVRVRLKMVGIDTEASMTYNVNGLIGAMTNDDSPVEFDILMPSGSISWSITLFTVSSGQYGTIELY